MRLWRREARLQAVPGALLPARKTRRDEADYALAGPRMLWRHPILTIRHLIDDKRPVPELPEKYRPKSRNKLPGSRCA